jgi:DNA-binding response OmpR family regulator
VTVSDGPLVLLVEDDDAIRLSLRDYLERQGHRIVVTSDGVGAIKVLIDEDVSAIITDFRMGQLDGDYWMRFLQKFCPDIPVLVMSGFLEPEFTVPFPTLTKPFDYGEIDARLRETLGT